MHREPKSLFSYTNRESTIILEMVFQLISLCSYRDCICFKLQLIGSHKSSICCIVHPCMLFSAQKWCMCLPWALWGSHSPFSLCPHCLRCSNCYLCGQVSGAEVLRAIGPHLSLLHLVSFGSRSIHGCFLSISGLEERIWSFISSTGTFQKQHSQGMF